jgi:hypothetical protein
MDLKSFFRFLSRNRKLKLFSILKNITTRQLRIKYKLRVIIMEEIKNFKLFDFN